MSILVGFCGVVDVPAEPADPESGVAPVWVGWNFIVLVIEYPSFSLVIFPLNLSSGRPKSLRIDSPSS
ncbi:hypothetical protein VQY16_02455 [Mesomycoplasma ovipneumoniae]